MTEANKLEIPVVGTGDTNVDPDELDFIIPANDDAIRAIRLLCALVADAAIEGAQRALRPRAAEPEADRADGHARARGRGAGATDELVAALAGGAALSLRARRRRRRPAARRPRRARRGGRRRGAAARRPPEEIAAELAREAAEKAEDDGRGRRLTRRPPSAARTRRHRTDIQRRPHAAAAAQENEQDMADISAELVKELRERTGAGFMDCKQALTETDGDLDKAIALLRERGLAAAAKKAGRDAREGLVGELHPHRRPGRRAHRGQLRDRLRGPQRRVPEARPRPGHPGRRPRARCTSTQRAHPGRRPRGQEGRAARRRVRSRRSPRTSASQIVEGQLKKWYSAGRACTSSRSATRSRPSRELITERIATIGENIRVRRFTRYALGEEL